MMTKNWKILQLKNLCFVDQKKLIHLFRSLPSYRRSIQPSREHPALQNMKFPHFSLFLWVIFSLLAPDPDKANQNQHGPHFATTLILFCAFSWCGIFLHKFSFSHLLHCSVSFCIFSYSALYMMNWPKFFHFCLPRLISLSAFSYDASLAPHLLLWL